MSASSFHTGLPSAFAHRSHTAFTTAAVARWMTPFSGPSHRSWLSPVMCRQKPPMSPAIDSSVRPTTSGASASTAATHDLVPAADGERQPVARRRPSARSVWSTTYAAE